MSCMHLTCMHDGVCLVICYVIYFCRLSCYVCVCVWVCVCVCVVVVWGCVCVWVCVCVCVCVCVMNRSHTDRKLCQWADGRSQDVLKLVSQSLSISVCLPMCVCVCVFVCVCVRVCVCLSTH